MDEVELADTVPAMGDIGHSAGSDVAQRRPPRNVLVLSGGGLNGALQAGVLSRLVNSGWIPDAIVGVSVGALNGIWIADRWTPAGAVELLDVWYRQSRRPVFDSRRLPQLLSLARRSDSLQASTALRELLDDTCPVADLADTAIEMHVGAVDMTTSKLTWWTAGPANDRLLASAALPGVLPPVAVDGSVFVDGGVLATVPVGRALELGPAHIVVVDASATRDAPGIRMRGPLGVVLHSFTMARHALCERDFQAAAESGARVDHLRLDIPSDLAFTDWHRVPELIAAGVDQFDRWLTVNGPLCTPEPTSAARAKVRERIRLILTGISERTRMPTAPNAQPVTVTSGSST